MFVSLLAKSEEVYFKFEINSRNEIGKISKIISIDNVIGNTIYAYANSQELENFYQLGYYIQVLPKSNQNFFPEMADSVTEMREWDSYPTYEAYVDMMYQFAADHPDICNVARIGHSVEGREILVANISDNPGVEEDEPEFLFTGQMHGDELVTFMMLLRLIDYITENYGTNDRITNIVDNIDIYINPLSNPDGTYAGGNNTVWDATRNNANGVNLNRNFPDPEDGQHPDGNDWQPENIIMMDFADEHTFVLSSNLHSGTEVLNYPWDTWVQRAADDEWWQEVCHTYADTVHIHAPANYMEGYDDGITNGFDWYTISGGRQDYMNYFKRCREMTLELSDEKYLPEIELEAHWEYNRQSFLLYMEECLYGIRGIVTNISSEPLLAEIKAIGHDIDNSEIFTDPELGNYHRMLFSGNYDIQYSSYGYIPQIIQNVQVTDNDIVVQNVQLEESPQYSISGVITNAFSSEPIENAAVEILNTPLEPVTTNLNGEFEIPSVYEDSYEIMISAVGFSTVIEDIIVNEQSTVFDYELFESETENFETGDFSLFAWEFTGDAEWEIDQMNSYQGTYSARSGDINDDQSSGLSINLETTYSGNVSFFTKTSSEAGFDYFTFYIDDVVIERWSGESDWQQFNHLVEAGIHNLKWEFNKDGNVSVGDDTCWLDYISFPPTGFVSASNQNEILNIKLIGNYPNPFNPQTVIKYQLSKVMPVELSIYNIKGQKVRTLINEQKEAGSHSVVWNGNDDENYPVSSGVYFYRMVTSELISSRKMLLLK